MDPAALTRPRHALDETSGRVTAVVATRDRAEDLRRSLPRHRVPVVVVDNASTDPLARAVVPTTRPDAVLVELGRNLGAPARNRGVEEATTPYVAFADDDSWWAPGALARAADLLDAHPRCALLAGRVLVGEEERLEPVSAAMAAAPLGREPDLPGPSVGGFVACGAVVRRDAFLTAGGFDPVVFFPGEEERLALDLLAAGWGLAYADDVVAHHHPSPSRTSPEVRRRAITRSAVLTAWMRRPLRVAARRTGQAWRAGGADRAGVRDAVRRLPAALARRRAVPERVERVVRRLEAAGG